MDAYPPLPPPLPGINLSESQVPRILGVNIACFILAVIANCLRFSSRRLIRAQLWWDDWLMFPALAFAGIMCFVTIQFMVPHGFGRHVWVDPEDAKRSWAQGIFITGLSYTGAICCIKCSVLAFYWRIFKRSRIRVPIYIVTAIVLCRGISAALVTVFQCMPVSEYWNHFARNSFTRTTHCHVHAIRFFIGSAIPNLLTDAAILVLPIPFVWKLHLPRAQKMALSSIFLLGAFVVGVSIARFTFVLALDLTSPDLTWNFVEVQIWTCVEVYVGIVCACLPTLRPLLNLLLFGSLARPTHDYYSGGGGDNGGGRQIVTNQYSPSSSDAVIVSMRERPHVQSMWSKLLESIESEIALESNRGDGDDDPGIYQIGGRK